MLDESSGVGIQSVNTYTATREYDADGNLTQQIDADGRTDGLLLR